MPPPTKPFSTADAALGTGMSLLVIERHGVAFEASEIKLRQDAAEYLKSAWRMTLHEIAQREPVAYSPEVVVRPDTPRVLVINEDLRDENDVVELVLADVVRAQVKPNALAAGRLYAYAVVSDTDAGRVAMIKKANPSKPARGGKAWALADDELVLMQGEPWQLFPDFDVVVSAAGGFALNSFFFEQLFSDSERLRAKVADWTESVAQQLAMTAGDRDKLTDACRSSARRRRRLRAIAHRGHIGRVTIPDVERFAQEMSLDVADFVAHGALIVHDDHIDRLLQLLNEDLTRGGLTHDAFQIEGKEPM